jgi:hypothetical protein
MFLVGAAGASKDISVSRLAVKGLKSVFGSQWFYKEENMMSSCV